MPSITNEQLAALTEPILADAQSNRKDYYDARELPALEKLLVVSAAQFIQEVQDNLDRQSKVSTGTLSGQIKTGKVIKEGQSYSISMGYPEGSDAAGYYDFVNKGVKGIKSGQPSDSPYRFRKLSAPTVMVDAILGWLRQNNISARTEDQPRGLSRLQTKREGLRQLDPQRTLATAIARNIKKRGLPYTGFFDKAITSVYGAKFVEQVGQVIGVDVQVQIIQGNKP
jgi:hypothetical protein